MYNYYLIVASFDLHDDFEVVDRCTGKVAAMELLAEYKLSHPDAKFLIVYYNDMPEG